MTVSLSDLKAKRAAMTQGEWDDAADGVHLWQVSPANATGIVATHNAADVLIEIAEAALAYQRPVYNEQDARDKEVARITMNRALAKIKP